MIAIQLGQLVVGPELLNQLPETAVKIGTAATGLGEDEAAIVDVAL